MKKSKPKRKANYVDRALRKFEAAFQLRIGLSPSDWIKGKIENGSRKEDVKYLYEVCAAEIAAQNHCISQRFENYFRSDWQKKEMKAMAPKAPKVYNKLVRDRIPEIIEEDGKRCVCETLPQERYIAMLDAKLNEELAEYQQSKSLEELADLLEVMGAVVKAKGFTWEELTAIRKKKLEARGGFEKRILLKEVYEGTPCTTGEPRREPQKTLPKNAGKPWTELEDQKLTDEFDSKMPITTIAIEHGRTKGAIESRLARLGKISKPQTESSDK
jgi:predicted house-cleaning noncanonical NTP pyrophosphatase (MazG superfamily)